MFKSIPGHREYVINEDGSIVKRVTSEKIIRSPQLKARIQKIKGKESGYYYVTLLSKDALNVFNEYYPKPGLFGVAVHRLVAMAWISPQPIDMPWVNHEDGNKLNNHYTNLKWGTIAYNIQHAHDTGLVTHKYGADHWNYGKKVKQSTRNKQSKAKLGRLHPNYKGQWITPIGEFESANQAGIALKISPRTVYNKCKANIEGYSFQPKNSIIY